jgi:hypothetical protein
MTLEAAEAMMEKIERTSCTELLEDLFGSAIRYSTVRSSFALMGNEERREADDGRTRLHDTFIANCNILARSMAACGEDDSWREMVGSDRKVVAILRAGFQRF